MRKKKNHSNRYIQEKIIKIIIMKTDESSGETFCIRNL